MFSSTKVKIAAGLATGALTLGAAGAYAAANNSTVSVASAKPVTVTVPAGATTPTFNLISLSGRNALTLKTFKSQGECVSTFAQNKDLALAPAAGTSKISKNFHGKLMSAVHSWCAQFNASKSAAEAQTAETPDATEPATTEKADAADSKGVTHGKSGQAHGKSGQAHGNSNQ
jgi:hypothetical protein